MESAANELNLGAFLPSMGFLLGFIRFLLSAAILIGPIVVLSFGLIYKKRPPKEANYSVGYRFWWGMASLESWTYTQALAGKVLSLLGWILSGVMLVMVIVCLFFELMTAAMLAVLCLIIELVVIAAACITINVIVMRKFDKYGFRRDAYID